MGKKKKSLAETHPEIAAEWNYEKNSITPEEVTAGSHQKVWWIRKYHDELTGKDYVFEWQRTIRKKVKYNSCPFTSGQAICVGFNDLASTHPEVIAEWNYEKNSLTPEEVTAGSGKKVWWIRKHHDESTGKDYVLEWEESINNRVIGKYCSTLLSQRLYKGFNDLVTTHPELVVEWNYEKNSITPEEVTAGSGKKVWWIRKHHDESTGKDYVFEWEAVICNRVRGDGCPYLNGKEVYVGLNDLVTTHPELAAEWNYEKNSITPKEVTAGSGKKVWWKQKHHDESTGRDYVFEWEAKICNRARGKGCPYTSGGLVYEGFNDLASKDPNLAKEWHPTLNRKRTSKNTYYRSKDRIAWVCPNCGKVWRCSVYERTVLGRNCSCKSK